METTASMLRWIWIILDQTVARLVTITMEKERASHSIHKTPITQKLVEFTAISALK